MPLQNILRATRIGRGHGIKTFLKTVRFKSITGYDTADKALQTVTGGRIDRWLDAYENFVGLTEVRQAQASVTQAENAYRLAQEERRNVQKQLAVIQSEIKALAVEIDKTTRGTDTYVTLVTKENEIIRRETKVEEMLNEKEEDEKRLFSALSSALRESHEKERARAERMKYWGIMGSVVGAVIGIVGTTVNNYLRMRELRDLVSSSVKTDQFYQNQTEQMSHMLKLQFDRIEDFLSEMQPYLTKTEHPSSKSGLKPSPSELKMDKVLVSLKNQEAAFEHEMKELRKLLVANGPEAKQSDNRLNQVVYLGPDIQEMFQETESNIIKKVKLQTALCAGLTITVAVVLTVAFRLAGG